MNPKYPLIDLFCGGGGSSTGFHQAGMETIIAVDHEKHCVDTFNANYPNKAIIADISNLRSEQLAKYCPNPFFITASPPCEPFTAANRDRIIDPFERLFTDPIGRLMIDAIRLIGDLEPNYFMIENVVGILQGESEELLRDEFKKVDIDEVYFNVIQASEWGIPSRRQRVIITNFRIKTRRRYSPSLLETISDLPPPNTPSDYPYHYTPIVPLKYQNKIPTTPQGEGLVYFSGAKKQMRNYLRLHGERVAPVVMGKSRFIHPTEDRMLTPQEHARLMTFPDTYQYAGTTEQIYDIIGEAVPPLLTHQIGEQAIMIDSKARQKELEVV